MHTLTFVEAAKQEKSMSITKRDKTRNQTKWKSFYANIPEGIHDKGVIEDAKSIVDYALPQRSGPAGTHYYSFLTREYVLNLILFFYERFKRFPEGDICVVDQYYWRSPPYLNKTGINTFFRERKKGRNYDPGYWVKLPSIKEVRKLRLIKQKQIDLWTSQAFLNKYFYQLKFNEPYSKATGTITGNWVRGPWDGRMKIIVLDFIYEYVNRFGKLPEGQHSFDVDWSSINAPWLKSLLHERQIVTFPKLSEVQYGQSSF